MDRKASKTVYMLASYEVHSTLLEKFIEELIATETAYREEGLITDAPIIRMSSQESPEMILEIIEFVDSEAVTNVMSNDKVQGHWGKLAGLWDKGNFPAKNIPEMNVPWGLMNAIHL